MNRTELEQYIADVYQTDAEYPWAKSPDYAVFRHQNNRKWFAVILSVSKEKLGLSETGCLDIVNLKCDPLMIGSVRTSPGFYPAYHMNKENWITAALDGTADDEQIKLLLDMSFDLTAARISARIPKKKEAKTGK